MPALYNYRNTMSRRNLIISLGGGPRSVVAAPRPLGGRTDTSATQNQDAHPSACRTIRLANTRQHALWALQGRPSAGKRQQIAANVAHPRVTRALIAKKRTAPF